METYIIAEIGVNHDGSIEKAKLLIDEAAKTGANAVKFQSFKAENITSKNTKKAQYQLNNTKENTSQYEMLKNLQLNFEDLKLLKEYSENKGLDFLSSPFDLESFNELKRLNIKYYKIPSGEITNEPLLTEVAKTGSSIILSTGMCYLSEVEKAINLIRDNSDCEIIVLQCNTEYPTPMEDVNLNVMSTYKKAFGVRVGYSDHTIGDEVPVAAVALGAEVIEKHFTINSNDPGPDHKASMEVDEFRIMVNKIRNVEKAIGVFTKKPTPSETKNKGIVRKKIIASKNINVNERFNECNITLKRSSEGLDAEFYSIILGKKANKPYIEGEGIQL
ncbi:N-acetylneuraminate synthase [Macrococcus armenti]|nr:N-acetylneuraminate synthase [Macrococcus armenti]UBH09364.1 N-acetylneuraminate synthase [Macrococcus armenti]